MKNLKCFCSSNFLQVMLNVLCMSTMYDSVYCVLCMYICCVINLLQMYPPWNVFFIPLPNKLIKKCSTQQFVVGQFNNSIPLIDILTMIQSHQFNSSPAINPKSILIINKFNAINSRINPNHISYNSAATLFIQLFYIYRKNANIVIKTLDLLVL